MLLTVATVVSCFGWVQSYSPSAVPMPYDMQRRIEPLTSRQYAVTSFQGGLHLFVVRPLRAGEPRDAPAYYRYLFRFSVRSERISTLIIRGHRHPFTRLSFADDEANPGLRSVSVVEEVNRRSLLRLTVPYGFIVCCEGQLLACVLVVPAYRAYVRPRQGLCARCGYDLRASPDRCPECGW